MTNEEAKERLALILQCKNCAIGGHDNKCEECENYYKVTAGEECEALSMAISALKKQTLKIVDAIPIKWLIKVFKRNPLGHGLYVVDLEEMLGTWRKENEENN